MDGGRPEGDDGRGW